MTADRTDYDVIVAGGGSAGVAAAVASARMGASTLLVERYNCLGGAATMRNVVTYCGLYTLAETPAASSAASRKRSCRASGNRVLSMGRTGIGASMSPLNRKW